MMNSCLQQRQFHFFLSLNRCEIDWLQQITFITNQNRLSMILYYKHDLLYKCLKQHFQFLFFVLQEIQTLDIVHYITVTVRKYHDPPSYFHF